jgi:hypothetical protein
MSILIRARSFLARPRSSLVRLILFPNSSSDSLPLLASHALIPSFGPPNRHTVMFPVLLPAATDSACPGDAATAVTWPFFTANAPPPYHSSSATSFQYARSRVDAFLCVIDGGGGSTRVPRRAMPLRGGG